MGSDGAPRADVVRQRRKRHLDDSATLRVPTKGGLYLMVDARRLSPRWSTPAAEDPQRPVAGNDRATAPAGVATWPARLQAWLQRLAPDQRVEVINAGVPGYRVIDNLIRLEMDLSRYRPDVVILYEGHNDLFGALRRTRVEPPAFISTPDEIPSVTPWGHWLTRHSLLYGKLVGRLEVLHFVASGRRASATGVPRLLPQAVVDTGARRFEQDLTAFLAVTRSFDIRVVIPELVQMSGVGSLEEPDSTIRRIWSYTVPFARPETVLQAYVRYNEALRNTARRFGATWIPTDSFGLAGKEWYEEGDPIHFNDRGAERMAQQLARALITRHALDVPPASAR